MPNGVQSVLNLECFAQNLEWILDFEFYDEQMSLSPRHVQAVYWLAIYVMGFAMRKSWRMK